MAYELTEDEKRLIIRLVYENGEARFFFGSLGREIYYELPSGTTPTLFYSEDVIPFGVTMQARIDAYKDYADTVKSVIEQRIYDEVETAV